MRAKNADPGLKVYLDVGSLEGIGKRSIQQEMAARTKEAYALLLNNGLPRERLRFVLEEGAPHHRSFFPYDSPKR
jgi:hypothetical protein